MRRPCFTEESREKNDGSVIDRRIVDVDYDDCTRADHSTKRGHEPRHQRSADEALSPRSSLQEKTANCGELETDRYGSRKILAGVRPIHRGIDFHQRPEIRIDPGLCR